MTFPYGETVTILTRTETGTDRYGNPTFAWPAPGVDVDGCAVAPRSATEPAQVGRQAVITGLTVYMPPGTVVGPYDRLSLRGVTYEVDGEAGEWVSPFSGWRPGVEVAVKRVEG